MLFDSPVFSCVEARDRCLCSNWGRVAPRIDNRGLVGSTKGSPLIRTRRAVEAKGDPPSGVSHDSRSRLLERTEDIASEV